MEESAQDKGKANPSKKHVQELESAIVRLAGDSGDGIQLTGSRFTITTAFEGNDLSTLPDFPAEIRAPVGTLAGVSAFQINFSHHKIMTPGDQPDVLVAFNPAALKANIQDLKPGGTVIVNSATFEKRNLQKADYGSNPLEDGSLDEYKVIPIDISRMVKVALEDMGLSVTAMDRSKNFFALGLMYWMYNRSLEPTLKWIEEKFAGKSDVIEANSRTLRVGYHFGETAEIFPTSYQIREAVFEPGTYRNITGNQALATGLVMASQLSGLPLFYGSYPITPASDILHELARHKNFGVLTFQAEDEIAAVGSAIGAAFSGALGVTGTSGPGMTLKAEAIGLAIMVELPLVVINVQRGGPSTGLPTKTEQADLFQALYGRNSEAPVAIVAPASPVDCFDMAIEAVRLATTYMTPVILLTDGHIANGAEPWRIPTLDELPEIPVTFRTDPEGFRPFDRDPDTLARPWVRPGTPGLIHRIGGLEKEEGTGNVSYDPANHEKMVRLRAEKIAGIAKTLPPVEVAGPEEGKLLVVGWGSTYGAIATAVEALQARGASVARVHLRYISPFQSNLGEVLSRYENILVPELNLGQLVRILRAEFLVDAVGFNKIQGKPFMVAEILDKIEEVLAS
ncbi:MAG: 2-oxoacid:acceptor oxidoreductase subunit alpha [bacterium]|nr:2-oxoacid:acceptor oxidoreductase subunit alpha [bacterium]